jgi:hypothetical protein
MARRHFLKVSRSQQDHRAAPKGRHGDVSARVDFPHAPLPSGKAVRCCASSCDTPNSPLWGPRALLVQGAHDPTQMPGPGKLLENATRILACSLSGLPKESRNNEGDDAGVEALQRTPPRTLYSDKRFEKSAFGNQAHSALFRVQFFGFLPRIQLGSAHASQVFSVVAMKCWAAPASGNTRPILMNSCVTPRASSSSTGTPAARSRSA